MVNPELRPETSRVEGLNMHNLAFESEHALWDTNVSLAERLGKINPSELDEVKISDESYHDSRRIELVLREADISAAPDLVTMLLEDMDAIEPAGKYINKPSPERRVSAKEPIQILLDILRKGLPNYTHFNLSIYQGDRLNNYRGNEDDHSRQRLGVTLNGLNTPQVYGPTDRFFDGVHQYVSGHYGRGEELERSLVHLQRHNSAVLADLVVQSAGWIANVIESRRITPVQTAAA